jgi:hypothetical protein
MSVESVLDGAFTELLGKVSRPQGAQQTQQRVVDIVFGFGARGTPLDGTEVAFLRLGLNGAATILSWSLAAMIGGIPAAGSVTVDVRAGDSLVTQASITAGTPPRLAAQVELNEQVPVGWSTSLTDPVTLLADVLAVDGVTEQIALTLRVAIAVDLLADEANRCLVIPRKPALISTRPSARRPPSGSPARPT